LVVFGWAGGEETPPYFCARFGNAFIGLIVKLTDESLDAINECTAGDLAFFALRSVRPARLYHYR
jgi:hypothetical protein